MSGMPIPTGPRADRVAGENPFLTPTRGIQSGSPFTTGGSGTVVGSEAEVDTTPTPTAFTPRADRLAETVSADNAQAVYPPQACIFVAK